jgi:hypothetical protein
LESAPAHYCFVAGIAPEKIQRQYLADRPSESSAARFFLRSVLKSAPQSDPKLDGKKLAAPNSC